MPVDGLQRRHRLDVDCRIAPGGNFIAVRVAALMHDDTEPSRASAASQARGHP
jgi:hypothetical protein